MRQQALPRLALSRHLIAATLREPLWWLLMRGVLKRWRAGRSQRERLRGP
jgi:hypothetical protein